MEKRKYLKSTKMSSQKRTSEALLFRGVILQKIPINDILAQSILIAKHRPSLASEFPLSMPIPTHRRTPRVEWKHHRRTLTSCMLSPPSADAGRADGGSSIEPRPQGVRVKTCCSTTRVGLFWCLAPT